MSTERAPSESTEPARPPVSQSLSNFVRRQFRDQNVRTVALVYGLTAALIIVATFLTHGTRSPDLTWSIVLFASVTAVVAYGQGIVVLTRGFDLSIPSVLTLGGVLLTSLSGGSNLAAIWAIPLVLFVGAGAGFFNGVGVAYLRISPIVMTLASSVIIDGIIQLSTNAAYKREAPPVLTGLMEGHAFGMPWIVLFIAVFTVAGSVVLHKTTFGRQVYAVGNSEWAAFLSAIRVRSILISVYMVSGVCAALGGMMLAGYAHRSYLGMGAPYLLPSVAAVVIGGTSVLGGRGTYIGTLAGALLLTALSTLLDSFAAPSAVKTIVLGISVLAAALISSRRS